MGGNNGHETLLLSLNILSSVVVPACNASTQETEAGRFQFKVSLFCFVFTGLKVHRISPYICRISARNECG